MCTWKISPLCRFTPPPNVIAGLVGEAPLVYKPVELLPSCEFWNRSNFTAMLFGIPSVPPGKPAPYPRPPPDGPSAVRPAFWIANVMPSALGVVNWKLKSVVKLCTFTGVVNQALEASDWPPSVNSKRVPFNFVLPLDAKPVAVKPEPKLMAVEPL